MSSFFLLISTWFLLLFMHSSQAKSDSIFGDVSREMEIIYIVLICVGGVCTILCIACILRKYCQCTKEKEAKDRSYARVVSGHGSIVNYVDENDDGNCDIGNIQMPLKNVENASNDQIVDRNEYETEGNEEENINDTETDDGQMTTKGYQSNMLSIPDQYERDDSISAMDI